MSWIKSFKYNPGLNCWYNLHHAAFPLEKNGWTRGNVMLHQRIFGYDNLLLHSAGQVLDGRKAYSEKEMGKWAYWGNKYVRPRGDIVTQEMLGSSRISVVLENLKQDQFAIRYEELQWCVDPFKQLEGYQ